MEANTSSRDDDATMTCPVCGGGFIPFGRARFCSTGCRQIAWRRRAAGQGAAVVVPPFQPRKPLTVYVCDACDVRAVGEQRCEECGSFMRRVGLGGTCPHCDEPVAVEDLLGEFLRPAGGALDVSAASIHRLGVGPGDDPPAVVVVRV